MKPIYEIRSGALAGFNLLVPRLGGDPAELLAEVGLPADCMRRPDQLIPIATLSELLDLCADRLRCADFGLRLADMQGVRILGVLGQLLMGSVNLRTALESSQRYMALHNQAEFWRIDAQGDALLAQRFDHFVEPVAAIQYRELSVGACYRLVQDLAGQDIRPREVHFRQEALSPSDRYREFFNADVYFGRECDALVFDAEVLERTLCAPNTSLRLYFEEFTRQLLEKYRHSVAAQVKALILQTLGAQRHTLAQVAGLLEMPGRTLQRRLAEERTSFKQLLQDARMETARWHLRASSIDINLLSATLGYTDISAFSKAFRAVHGVSPLQWRKQQRDAEV